MSHPSKNISKNEGDMQAFVALCDKKSLSKLIDDLNEISSMLASDSIEIEKLSFYYEKAIFLKNLCLQRLSAIEVEIKHINDKN